MEKGPLDEDPEALALEVDDGRDSYDNIDDNDEKVIDRAIGEAWNTYSYAPPAPPRRRPPISRTVKNSFQSILDYDAIIKSVDTVYNTEKK